MSRSGYSDDYDQWSLIRYRGAVASATRGKRGQAFFTELLAALEAMPDKRLISQEIVAPYGEVCALGALGRARALDMSGLDPEDAETVAGTFGIADALAREVVFMNDEGFWGVTPEQRYEKMLGWVKSCLGKQGAS